MNGEEEILSIMPRSIYEKLYKRLLEEKLYEIRIKIGKPILIYSKYGESIINYVCSEEDMNNIVKKIVGYSLYAYEEEIKNGFITLRGGNRVGVAGECINEGGIIRGIKNISSVNIRISSEIIGCSDKIMKYIVSERKIFNTIIISPPRCGKTTILRDIARNISSGIENGQILDFNFYGKKVVIVDERSEIAACYRGMPQNNIGIRCDVLDNCSKKEGLIMAVRSLSPEVIICDEIGSEEDVKALINAFNCGVNIITTIHGFSIEDLFRRKSIAELIENEIIDRVIVLSAHNGAGTIENIYEIRSGQKKCLK